MASQLTIDYLKKNEKRMMATGFFERHWRGALLIFGFGIALGLLLWATDDSVASAHMNGFAAAAAFVVVGMIAIVTFCSLFFVPMSLVRGARYLAIRKHLGNKKAIYPAIAEFNLAAVLFSWLGFFASTCFSVSVIVGFGIMAVAVACLVFVFSLFHFT